MTVNELIESLKALPPGASVLVIWDGAARTEVRHVYLARGGDVMLADEREVVYDNKNRPHSAPTEAENRYLETPALDRY